MNTILFTLALGLSHIDVQTRTLVEDLGQDGLAYTMVERIVSPQGFTLVSKSLYPDGGITFAESDFLLDGTPVRSRQEGQWNERWNIFETLYGRDSATQKINEQSNVSRLKASTFRDPKALWFWKTRPKIGESITVKFLAQNTISTFEIKFTYEGDEVMTLRGRKVTLHRVREQPLSASEGVYTIWWYDDKGMGVKRYHKTTTKEFKTELHAWR